MEAFNIPRCPKIYLTGFIWNSWRCRAGPSATGKLFQSASPRHNGPTTAPVRIMIFVFLFSDEIAETDIGVVSNDNN
jgi:hypothetical protein